MIHLKCKPSDISEYVIFCGDPNRVKLIAENYLENIKLINTYRGLLVYTGKYKNIDVSVITSGMGSPSFAIVFEEVSACGCKVGIRFGTCGALDNSLEVGDFVVATAAYPLVGILKNYKIENLPPVCDFDLTVTLIESLKEKDLKFKKGMVATSDGFYTEKQEANWLRDKNILACEMETACLFALGHIKNVKTASLLVVVDKIFQTQEYDPQDPLIKNKILQGALVVLNTIIKWVEKENKNY